MSVDQVDQAQSKTQVVDQDLLTTSVANSVQIDCVYSIHCADSTLFVLNILIN